MRPLSVDGEGRSRFRLTYICIRYILGGMETMALKKTMMFLDPEDHRALFERALEESRQAGRRVSLSEIIRRAIKAYLQATPAKVRRKPSR